MEPSNSFSLLPTELLLQILSYANLTDLRQLCQTSSKLRQICGDEVLWQSVYQKLNRSNDITYPHQLASKQIGSTWLERSMFLYNLTHPGKVYTFTVYEEDTPSKTEEEQDTFV